jgi:hypothetical protein
MATVKKDGLPPALSGAQALVISVSPTSTFKHA